MVKRNAGRVQGSVRIIAGEWRGRRIAIPDGTAVRPTPDRVRETVFNWLRDSLAGARCLDSVRRHRRAWVRGVVARRGGSLVRRAGRCVGRGAARDGATARRDAAHRSPRRARVLARAAVGAFDVVFLDPPYAQPLDPLLDAVASLARAASADLRRAAAQRTVCRRCRGAQWLKQSHAGAVEYGLLRFDEATMPRKPPSEAHPP